jgi:RNA polymerase sigma-70 factor (ECF subfamily)
MVAESTKQTDLETERILRAQQGDRDAFGDLVSQHHQRVISVVYRMCGEMHIAEDATQIAFLRAWQNLPDYQSKTSFRSWLYRIAINAALDMLRREKSVENIEHAPLSQSFKTENHLMKEEQAQFVKNAVLNLPETSRTVLILREYEDLSYKEISETLAIPVGTVMSRLNYARKTLAKVLKPSMEDR